MKYISLLITLILTMQAGQAEEVNVYSGRKEALIKPLFDEFTEQTGIRVNLVTGKADALIKRLELEGENSPADLLLTVDAGRLFRAKQQGLLQAITSAALNETVPENYRDPEGYWYGLSIRARVIVYSRTKIEPAQLSTYETLANPVWQNQLCVRSSSNIYNQSLVASMLAHHGREETEKWISGLVGNFARDPKGGDRDQIKAVAAGQCKLALVNSYYLAGMLSSDIDTEVAAADQVALFWPNQEGRGAHVNVSGAGVTRSARNRTTAVRLLEYLISIPAQEWYGKTNHEFPVREGVAGDSILQSWGAFKADSLNLAVLGENNQAAVRAMDRAGWK